MNPYYYLYYKIYKFTSKLGKWEVAESAAYGMTTLIVINFITLFSKYIDKGYIALIGFAISIYSINHFLFPYKKKYLKIIEKHQSESKLQSKIGGAIVILYVIATFVTLFL